MTESIIIGIVVGVVVAGVGAVISHYLRRAEMEALWAEEERRRKSDRKREIYERELKILSDATDIAMETIEKAGWALHVEESQESLDKWIGEALMMIGRARIVIFSVGDEKLKDLYNELVDTFASWSTALYSVAGKEIGTKENETENLRKEVRFVAAKIRWRIRQLLEQT